MQPLLGLAGRVFIFFISVLYSGSPLWGATIVPVGDKPESVAIDSILNQAVVAHEGSQDLWVIDLVNQSVLFTITLNTNPGAIAIDSHTPCHIGRT